MYLRAAMSNTTCSCQGCRFCMHAQQRQYLGRPFQVYWAPESLSDWSLGGLRVAATLSIIALV